MTTQHEIRPLTPTQLEVLMRDLEQWRVAERKTPGSSAKMSYLKGHDVKAMLTRVFGFGGFSADLIEGKILRLEEITVAETRWDDSAKRKVPIMEGGVPKTKTQWRAVATATVRLAIHQLGSTYTEMAVSSQQGVDPGEVADFAIKTAETDALKRAAIYLGTQFGLSLYENGQLSDTVIVIFEPTQAEQLQQGRNEAYAAWVATQQAAAQPAGAPLAAPQGPPQVQAPSQQIYAGSEAQGAAMQQLAAGMNQ